MTRCKLLVSFLGRGGEKILQDAKKVIDPYFFLKCSLLNSLSL